MKICQSYEKAHKEIRLFREKKRGMGDARNTGLKRATGSIYALLMQMIICRMKK